MVRHVAQLKIIFQKNMRFNLMLIQIQDWKVAFIRESLEIGLNIGAVIFFKITMIGFFIVLHIIIHQKLQKRI